MEFFAPINEFRAANNRITIEILAGAKSRRSRRRLRRHRLVEPVAAEPAGKIRSYSGFRQ
jgi:hypothetical protein